MISKQPLFSLINPDKKEVIRMGGASLQQTAAWW
jgi:hypothetical protein